MEKKHYRVTCRWYIEEVNCKVWFIPSPFPPSLFSFTGWDKEIDLQKTIQLMRTQRPGMVQTEVRVADVNQLGINSVLQVEPKNILQSNLQQPPQHPSSLLLLQMLDIMCMFPVVRSQVVQNQLFPVLPCFVLGLGWSLY